MYSAALLLSTVVANYPSQADATEDDSRNTVWQQKLLAQFSFYTI
jgi:hypothetical protein